MTVEARLHRACQVPSRPSPMLVEFHEPDCPCPACTAFEPAAHPVPDRLTFFDIGWLALAGAFAGSAIAFAVDPHGAWRALVSCFGGM